MGKLPLTEFIDVFPLLITKQEIFGYDDDEEAEVVNTILDDGNLGNHDLIDNGHTSKTRDFFESFPNISFLVRGNIIKNPNMSVANPGIINNNAPKAIAAPDIISYAGVSFFIICDKPERIVFNPSYLA